MEGWTQRLFTTLVLAAIVLVAAFVALGLGMNVLGVVVMGLTLFAAMVTVQLVVEMRRDVRMLKTQALVDACEVVGQKATITMRPGYDHSYFFVSTFIPDHVAFHAERLKG